MILSFTLSMPGCNSWNGRWSGEDRLYVIVKNFGNTKKKLEKAMRIKDVGYYHYSFGDGWAAGVTVEEVDSKQAARLRKKSCGFSGYDWMVDSIIKCNEIKPRTSVNT